MNLVLLEASTEGLPPVLAGVVAFVALLSALIWVIGMGSGRPNSK
ncbi:hypothetical protein [uncultured Tessaracoccus sp.]|nr:hypothetical protein [uncultured Tessaracoccus sp.]